MSKFPVHSFLMLAAIAVPAPPALANLAVPNRKAPPGPAPAANACEVMRRTAHQPPESDDKSGRHLADRRIEQAIRQFYAREVLASGIDHRSIARRPPIFWWRGTSPGTTTAPCVELWRADVRFLPDRPARFAADHQYAEIRFYLDRHEGGDCLYEAFVDVATKQVVAMFYWEDNEP